MASNRHLFPSYLKQSLLVLIILLMGISVARLLVSMHKMEERLDILEDKIANMPFAVDQYTSSGNYTSPQRSSAYQSQGHSGYQSQGNSAYQAQGNSAFQSRGNDGNRAYTNDPQGAVNQTNRDFNQPQNSMRDSVVVTDVTVVTDKNAPTGSGSNGQKSHKFTEARLFDLNTIDSVTLIRIPGIAEKTASIILKYRQRYGGFYSPWQLQEFLTWDAAQAYMDEWCNQWFTADASHIRHIQVNIATVSELQRHPYISHDQAIEMARYRTRHKRISSAIEMQQFTTFNSEQLKQLLPYLSFE